jgi:GTP-binding protein
LGLGKATLSFTVLEAEKVPQSTHPRWAVLGRSNVGKSSFLNALLHPHELFRTGRTPGVTIGLVAAKIDMGRDERAKLEIVDLPGFGYSKQKGMDRRHWEDLGECLRQRSSHGLLWIWLIDPLREPEEMDFGVMKWLEEAPYVLIFTKADQVKRSQRNACEKKWEHFLTHSAEKAMWFSSLKGEGFEEVAKMARQFLKTSIESQEIA